MVNVQVPTSFGTTVKKLVPAILVTVQIDGESEVLPSSPVPLPPVTENDPFTPTTYESPEGMTMGRITNGTVAVPEPDTVTDADTLAAAYVPSDARPAVNEHVPAVNGSTFTKAVCGYIFS